MKIVQLGGEQTVTGSCHLFQVNGLNILVDCGLAQGCDLLGPMDAWPVAPGKIDFLFLTHAHIDHIGRVPELVQKGFRGEILTTHVTKALMSPMLKDASAFSPLTELESVGLLKVIDRLSWGFEYGVGLIWTGGFGSHWDGRVIFWGPAGFSLMFPVKAGLYFQAISGLDIRRCCVTRMCRKGVTGW